MTEHYKTLSSLLDEVELIKAPLHLSQIKALIEDCKQWQTHSFSEHDVPALVSGRAMFVDKLLSKLFTIFELVKVDDLALVAVGGYGRGQLHPFSDIDLLFLTENPINDKQGENIGKLITLLWDIGLDIGQSVRTIEQTIELAKEDVTIATNLLENRLLAGNPKSLSLLLERTRADDYWCSEDFFTHKYQEQLTRHSKFNDTAYNLEPNLKENPGCLRDIQTVGWVAKKHFGVLTGQELVDLGYLEPNEFSELIECRNHLWQLRFALHLTAGRGENRLLFEYQPVVAEMMGFGSSKSSVESMMKQLFRVIRRITELNSILLQHFDQILLKKGKYQKTLRIDDKYQLRDGLIHVKNDVEFSTPQHILDLFDVISQNSKVRGISAQTLRKLRNARRQNKGQYFVEDGGCRQTFIGMIRRTSTFGIAWDLMHKHGILQAYFPEWDHIVGLMQFDLFHAYTVDEHTHRLVKFIHRYTLDEFTKEFPRCSRLMKNMDKPELIFLGAIFHDICKGKQGDHSQLGKEVALEFCQNHGLSDNDSKMVAWLVENHLLMSIVAQKRDISDPEVVRDFSAQIRDEEHLNCLYPLTLADIRATNDKLWNGWKASLLKDLYLQTMQAFHSGEEKLLDMRTRIRENKKAALDILLTHEVDPDWLSRLWSRHKPDYFVRFPPRQLVEHALAIHAHGQSKKPLIHISNETHSGGTSVFVYFKDSPTIFVQLAVALDNRNFSVHDAQMMSTKDGFAIHALVITDKNGQKIQPESRIISLIKALQRQLMSETIPATQRKQSRRMKQFRVKTRVKFLPTRSQRTLIEIETLDRPGLLATICRVFQECSINLHAAKIMTIGEKAEDFFMLSNTDGEALFNEQEEALRNQLINALNL